MTTFSCVGDGEMWEVDFKSAPFTKLSKFRFVKLFNFNSNSACSTGIGIGTGIGTTVYKYFYSIYKFTKQIKR
jgi:hypothetical protein